LAVEVKGLRKSFGDNEVLHGIDLSFQPGEVTGLMGANGAGKSTLIKILDGLYTPGGGTILVDDDPVRNLADHPKVGFVHQDLGLVADLSIASNLNLDGGSLACGGMLISHREERRSALRALERVGLAKDPDTPVARLHPGEWALVALARILDRGSTVLFVDEATSTLPTEQARLLTTRLRRLATDGATVVIVTHRLNEILEATDRVVVLVDGVVAHDERTSGLDRPAVANMLLAHGIHERDIDMAAPARPGRPILTLEGAYAGDAGPVDLTLRGGEILGLTGAPGSGLHDVALLASGHLKLARGSLVCDRATRRALVPPHRESQGGFNDLDIKANMAISSLAAFTNNGVVVRDRLERRTVSEMAARLSVVPPDTAAILGTLSGGNKQKVIIGRALMMLPQLLVLCEPTRGVDVSTRRQIYALLRDVAAQGTAVFITTSDGEDLVSVCDLIGVVDNGVVSAPRPLGELSQTMIEAII
jgi:ribose transport system ATP-binding protein